MARSTVFLARSIGLFILCTALGLLIRGNAIIEATIADGPHHVFLGPATGAPGPS